VDDATRLSELAVPIIHDGSVIGVLDSEHPEPGFFTAEHVRLLTTIVSLAATRIDTALAIENLQSTVGRLSVAEKDLEKKAKELEKAKLEADRASVEKSQFLANMSHEIRTPMTAVLGYAELLTRPDKSVADKEDWISHIHLNASHLLGLVNDVLDLSRIESGEFHANIQNCRLDKLITDVVALMRPRAEERGLSF
jgi:signal transduction histidine kinase